MHQYNREHAEKIIEEIFEGKYVVTEERESKNYFFVSYKHKLYDEDDDRAGRIGVGPLVFYKNNGEYKLSGTGDFLGGSYEGEMEQAYSHIKKADSIYEELSIPEIIAGIQRRKYVNLLDAHFCLRVLQNNIPILMMLSRCGEIFRILNIFYLLVIIKIAVKR